MFLDGWFWGMGYRGFCLFVLIIEVIVFLGFGRVGVGRLGRWVGICIYFFCTGSCRVDRLYILSG